jgi:hypothetical protein
MARDLSEYREFYAPKELKEPQDPTELTESKEPNKLKKIENALRENT